MGRGGAWSGVPRIFRFPEHMRRTQQIMAADFTIRKNRGILNDK